MTTIQGQTAETARSAASRAEAIAPRVAMICDLPDQGLAWASALTDAGYAVAPLFSSESEEEGKGSDIA